jgi:hypothetical protein
VILQNIARAQVVQEDIVALWQRTVLGDARARKGLLQCIMPASVAQPDAHILRFKAALTAPSREAA